MTPLSRLTMLLLAASTLAAALPAPVAAEGSEDLLVLRAFRAGDRVTYLDPRTNHTEVTTWTGRDVLADPFGTEVPSVTAAVVYTFGGDGPLYETTEYFEPADGTFLGSRSSANSEWTGGVRVGNHEVEFRQGTSAFATWHLGTGLLGWVAASGRTWAPGDSVAVSARPDAFGQRSETLTAAGWRDREGERLFRIDVGANEFLWYDGQAPVPKYIEKKYAVPLQIFRGFEEGTGPTLFDRGHVAPPSLGAYPGAPRSPYGRDGPGDAILADAHYPQALAAVSMHSEVRSWLERHPDAYVGRGQGILDLTFVDWTITYVDGVDHIQGRIRGERVGPEMVPYAISVAEGRSSKSAPPFSAYDGQSFACLDHARARVSAPGDWTLESGTWRFSFGSSLVGGHLTCIAERDVSRYARVGSGTVEPSGSGNAFVLVGGVTGGLALASEFNAASGYVL